MANHSTIPKALILGYSFVRRLKCDLRAHFDERATPDCGLQGTAIVRMHGVGGRTVQKVIAFDLRVLRDFSPDVVLLELGTNDLASGAPEVVGSQIEELIQLLKTEYSVRLVIWC